MKFLLYLIYIYIKYNKNFINILIMFITKKKNVKKILKNNTGTAKISIIQSKTLSKTKSKKLNKNNIVSTRNNNNNINKDTISKIFYNSNNTHDPHTIVNNLKLFIKQNINNNKFLNYISNLKQITNINIGASGGTLHVLKYDIHKIFKVFNYNININKLDKLVYYNKCILINNKLNEILMYLVINNIDNFIDNININDIQLIKEHTLQLIDFSISESGSLIIIPIIGIKIKHITDTPETPETPKTHDTNETPDNTTFITNFKELIVHNHLICLKKLYINKEYDIINIYDEFISNHIETFYKIFRILQKHIQYLHCDVKLTNVFIKFKKCNKIKYNILRDRGIYIDFILILGDLEKSTYVLNNNKIITYSNNILKTKFLNLVTDQLYNYIKYNCDTIKYNKACSTIPIYNYDLLSFIIDLFILYLQISEKITDYTPKTINIVKTYLNLNTIQINILFKILIDKKYNFTKHHAYFLNTIIAKYCKALVEKV